MEVTIGVSNRHVHLTEEHLKILFNDDLEIYRKINQPGQFASTFFVTIKTDKNQIENVRVLGPVRDYTQVEISKTDAKFLGIDPPVRESGDLKGSSSITLIGPNGELTLDEGCIIADRHIHILPRQVELYNLEGVEKVDVLLNGEKGGIISNVYLRVSDNAYFELHIDTDDANSHLVKNGDIGFIINRR